MTDYQRIERAIRYIEANFREQPSLARVAQEVGLSEFHFQRLFTRWAGISPKRFLQFLTADYAKQLLEQSRSVLAASYEAGLSGPSRLHDLLVSVDALTPGQHRNGGADLDIRYGFAESPFGQALVASTTRGVCALSFFDDDDAADAVDKLRARWPNASYVADDAGARRLAGHVFARERDEPLRLHLRGTNFQLQVWQALLRIPAGRVVAYQDIATALDLPTGSRAVGAAVGANPVGYLIPCHRVIRSVGAIGDYRWGATRKRALLAWEAAQHVGASASVA